MLTLNAAGTLMSPKVLNRVIYGTLTPEPWRCAGLRVRPAILRGFSRRQVRYADYPGIVADEGKSVKGTYVTGLNSGDMHRLDIFEGCQYDRETVKVLLLDESGKEVGEAECSTYVFSDEEDLLKDEWSFERFVRDKMHRWIGESKEYSGMSARQRMPPKKTG